MPVFPMGRAALTSALAVALATGVPAAARAGWIVPDEYQDELVVSGLSFPVGMAFLPDGRFVVVEKDSARVRLVVNDALAANDPLLRVPNVRSTGFEQGLLGVAIDPGFPARPYLYVHYDYALSWNIRVSRFTLAGDLDFTGNGELTCDPATRYDLITDIPDIDDHHNGGTLRFGPDGMLYVSLGEDNNPCYAQNLNVGLGSILRLDVSQLPDGPGGPPSKALLAPADNPYVAHPDPEARLVWAAGFRNPYRFTIDPTDGVLYVGDVGTVTYEELNVLDGPGLNGGWPLFEGNLYTFWGCAGVDTTGRLRPAYSYAREVAESGAAITGAAIIHITSGSLPHFPPEYDGDVFITDVYAGWLRRIKRTGGVWAIATPVPEQDDSLNWGSPGNPFVVDLLQGPDGMLYYVQALGVGEGATPAVRRIGRRGYLDATRDAATEVGFRAPWPSPARGRVRFPFTLPRAAAVSLTLHDVSGRLVSRIASGRRFEAGAHEIEWDASAGEAEWPRTGLYFARLVVEGRTYVRRVTVLR